MTDRKIIQLMPGGHPYQLVALCDDGSVWVLNREDALHRLHEGTWVRLPSIPRKQ